MMEEAITEKLYTDFGVLPTGEVDEDEVVMSMEL